MKKINEVSFDELHGDKNANFYFHALTGEKIEKIEKPSLEHPFFVTRNLDIAYEYADEKDIPRENKYIYILRLNNEEYFDFFDKWYLSKIMDKKMVEHFYRCVNSYRSLMGFSDTLGIMLPYLYAGSIYPMIKDQKQFDEIMANLETDKFKKLIKPYDTLLTRGTRILESLEMWKICFYLISEFREEFLSEKFKQVNSRVETRRAIKGMLFKLVVDKTNYRMIGEKDTINWTNMRECQEFGILDISVIKDIIPYPVNIDEIESVMKKIKG